MDIRYQGLIWVGIHVESLDVSINFYKNILGLPLVEDN
jgi:catechol 2,3-dioxygenase-like lactoylglutathione lyase family enzyme